mmetsp:Transcript_73500/g.215481  ORF Transcript_73500/g.215481 Transcript_73500/m.215481 type:complete len:138 (+) Transcript_73500:80-493(+)
MASRKFLKGAVAASRRGLEGLVGAGEPRTIQIAVRSSGDKAWRQMSVPRVGEIGWAPEPASRATSAAPTQAQPVAAPQPSLHAKAENEKDAREHRGPPRVMTPGELLLTGSLVPVFLTEQIMLRALGAVPSPPLARP